jgi:hypothetical protein
MFDGLEKQVVLVSSADFPQLQQIPELVVSYYHNKR